jgi:hypothetical protein
MLVLTRSPCPPPHSPNPARLTKAPQLHLGSAAAQLGRFVQCKCGRRVLPAAKVANVGGSFRGGASFNGWGEVEAGRSPGSLGYWAGAGT